MNKYIFLNIVTHSKRTRGQLDPFRIDLVGSRPGLIRVRETAELFLQATLLTGAKAYEGERGAALAGGGGAEL